MTPSDTLTGYMNAIIPNSRLESELIARAVVIGMRFSQPRFDTVVFYVGGFGILMEASRG